MYIYGQYNTILPEVICESQKLGNNQELEESAVKSPKEITITYGYSGDHIPELKQFIIEMICSVDGDIPIYIFKTSTGKPSRFIMPW
jgi:hypothetical protein|nr:hypothetical protein [Trichormus azollae]